MSGKRNSKHVIAQRQAETAALALAGLSPDEIAKRQSTHRTTVFRDLAELDLGADHQIESIELRMKHRTNELERYRKLDAIIADSPQMCESEKIAAFLAVSDRRIKLLNLDDARLMNPSENGDGPVTVVINVDFE